jgi:hypothetical protein
MGRWTLCTMHRTKCASNKCNSTQLNNSTQIDMTAGKLVADIEAPLFMRYMDKLSLQAQGYIFTQKLPRV